MTRASRYERPILKWIMTILFAAACLQTAVDLLAFHASIEYSQEKGLTIGTSMTPTVDGAVSISSVAPELISNLPAGVTPTRWGLPVTIPVGSSGVTGALLGRILPALMDLIFVGISWLLRGMVLSAVGEAGYSDGNPFVRANVRRLRMIGILMAVAPLIDLLSRFAVLAFVVQPALKDTPVLEFGVQFGWLAVALLVFILAEVFAMGVRMREDVEGLV